MVIIDFEITRDGMSYKDAIVLPEDHGISDDQILAMQQERFEVWYANVIASQNKEEIIQQEESPMAIILPQLSEE